MKYEKGFTFLELLIVLALAAILATSSSLIYGGFIHRNALQNTTNGVIGQLRKAQIYAMEGRESSSWGVHNGLTQLVLFKGSTYGGRDVTFDETFAMYSPATISGFTDIVFSRMTGTPSGASTIVISTSIATQSVTINNMGAINR